MFCFRLQNSKHDKSHMAAAKNHLQSIDARKDTYHLTNVVPMPNKLNKGKWFHIERHIRKIARQSPGTYVACGPLFIGNKEREDLSHMTYEVIKFKKYK